MQSTEKVQRGNTLSEILLGYYIYLNILWAILMSIVLFVIGILGMSNELLSPYWPTTQSKIISSSIGEVVENSSDDKNIEIKYTYDISYQYSINNQKYTGKLISFAFNEYENPEIVEKIIKQYPVGKHVTVFYMPLNPKQAVLDPGFKSEIWYAFLCVLLLLSGACFNYWLYGCFLRKHPTVDEIKLVKFLIRNER